MSPITVTTKQLVPENRSVTLVIDGQIQHRAQDGSESTVAELLNAIFAETGQPGRMVEPDPETGEITLDDRVFILRDGVSGGRTSNGAEVVEAGDSVIVDRAHTNG